MRMRAAASAALIGATLLGLTGCEYFSPQQTTRAYSASDGVNGAAGAVDIRNAFLVTLDDRSASLVVSLINTSNTPRSVSMQYASTTGPTTQSVEVPGTASLAIRPGQPVTVTFSGLKTKTGALLPVYFSSGGKGAQLAVPVLDNTLPGYQTLTPSPTPTPTASDEQAGDEPSPTDSDSAQPSESPSAG